MVQGRGCSRRWGELTAFISHNSIAPPHVSGVMETYEETCVHQTLPTLRNSHMIHMSPAEYLLFCSDVTFPLFIQWCLLLMRYSRPRASEWSVQETPHHCDAGQVLGTTCRSIGAFMCRLHRKQTTVGKISTNWTDAVMERC